MRVRRVIAMWAASLWASPLFAQQAIEKKVHDRARPVVAYIPKTQAPGMIVALHGVHSSGPAFAGSFPIGALVNAGYIVVFPTSIQGAWSGVGDSLKEDLRQLRNLFDTFTKEYNVHPDKIHIIGHSAGGMMSCFLVGAASELDGYRIRSVCAHGGGFSAGPPLTSRVKETRLWVLCGERDERAAAVKEMADNFIRAGFDTKYQVVPGKGADFPLVPFSEMLKWWQDLDKDAPDYAKIRAALDRGAKELQAKNFGAAYLAFQEAKKAGSGSESIVKEAEAGLAKVEQEAKRLLAEAKSLQEKDPKAAKKMLREIAARFARTPHADAAKKALDAIP